MAKSTKKTKPAQNALQTIRNIHKQLNALYSALDKCCQLRVNELATNNPGDWTLSFDDEGGVYLDWSEDSDFAASFADQDPFIHSLIAITSGKDPADLKLQCEYGARVTVQKKATKKKPAKKKATKKVKTEYRGSAIPGGGCSTVTRTQPKRRSKDSW